MHLEYYESVVLFLIVMVVLIVPGCKPESTPPEKQTPGKVPPTTKTGAQITQVVALGAKVEKVVGDLGFTEGPVADREGNIFFTDIANNRIHLWHLSGTLSTFRENTGGSNGLIFDKNGNLLACEGTNRRVVAIDPQGKVTVLAEKYDNKRLNSPNDMWIDPKGGIYFTDPRYGDRSDLEQDGEHVYYLTPDGKSLIRVVDDLVRPNGLIGTPNGKLLYIGDHGNTWAKEKNLPGNKTYVYKINPDGSLSDKKLFAPVGSDGMTIDSQHNIYLTYQPDSAVMVYNSEGKKIDTIKIPEVPTNVGFGGEDKRTLYITAIHSLYSVRMLVKGL